MFNKLTPEQQDLIKRRRAYADAIPGIEDRRIRINNYLMAHKTGLIKHDLEDPRDALEVIFTTN